MTGEQAVEIRSSFEVFAFFYWLKLLLTWTIEKTESFAGKIKLYIPSKKN